MIEHGKFVSEYQDAVRSMREGKFDLSVSADLGDEVGKLGFDLNNLARELERKFNEANKLHEISEEVTAGIFLDDVLNRAYASFRPVIPYNRMGCALLSDENKIATAYWGRTDASNVRIKIGYSAPMAGSSLQAIIETGQPRILNDLEVYLEEHPDSFSTRLLVDEGMRSNLTCPLIAQGKPVGFLFFTSMKKNAYQNIHQDVFLQIAGQISILVEKSRLYQQLYELNQKLIAAQYELKHRAMHDSLTGIYNHGAIVEHLEAQLARSRRNKQTLSIIMIDVDNFKQFNDTYGHLAGDAMLKFVAARMKECLREYDYIGRYGGEEFLVVLSDVDYETAVKTAERLNLVIGGETVAFGGNLLAATISLGVAVVENSSIHNIDEIIMGADRELYKAKSNGRNRFEVCRI
jgi:diguanylate cyclase (GGDEF)-like protein